MGRAQDAHRIGHSGNREGRKRVFNEPTPRLPRGSVKREYVLSSVNERLWRDEVAGIRMIRGIAVGLRASRKGDRPVEEI